MAMILGAISAFPNPKTVINRPIYSSSSYVDNRRPSLNSKAVIKMAATEIERLGIKIVKNPPESILSELGVRSWPKWGCSPSKFPWTYNSKETCYVLEGKVKVYPDGTPPEEAVEIGAGDLVVFPKGMSCTWDVSQSVDKHYKFD